MNPVTLESVQKADRELREKRERLREEVSVPLTNLRISFHSFTFTYFVQVEEEDRRLSGLSFEERTRLLEQMRREVNREESERINAMIMESGVNS